MLRGAGGYTILELMIVLAVSVIILVTAAITVGGTSGKTQFTTSMRDVYSKIQDWTNDVSDGFAGGTPNQYRCTLNATNHPQISVGTGSTSPNCIFLGKTLQFLAKDENGYDGKNTIYAYSVFGRRTIDTNGTLADSILNANPVPAVGSAGGTGDADLTERYSIGGGTTVKSISATSSPVNASGNMIGFFNSLNSNNSINNGSQDLNAYVYGLEANQDPGNFAGGSSASVIGCIQLTLDNCFGSASADQRPLKLISWKACFASAYSSQTAQITIEGQSSGVRSKLEFVAC